MSNQNNIRKFREKKGLTQGQLAKRAGVTRQTVNQIESGKSGATLYVANRIAKVLGELIEVIFGLK